MSTTLYDMKILGHGNLNHSLNPVRNFCEGIYKSDGHSIRLTKKHELTRVNLDDYDVFVHWSVRGLAQKLLKRSDNVIILENAYLNNIQSKMKVWVSVGWNGLNGRADFCNKDMPDDRWKKHFNDGRLLDYSDGDYILIPLQIKSDMSIAGKGFNYQSIVNEIRKFSDLPIKIKQHPTADDQWPRVLGKDISYLNRFMPIEKAVKGAKVVVTINSNAGVDAVLAGKPVVALDKGSMVYDIAMHDFTNLNVPKWPDRTQWCNNIAYAQWHPDELRSGEAWEHLKQKLFTTAQT
jgi:hypothetical protein